MGARSPARARFLGLWTAGWLALLLVLAMVRFGDPALQWPVLVVPALWALVALRPRRSAGVRTAQDEWADEEWPEDEWAEDDWPDDAADDRWAPDAPWPPPGERTDTVERPALRRRAGGGGPR